MKKKLTEEQIKFLDYIRNYNVINRWDMQDYDDYTCSQEDSLEGIGKREKKFIRCGSEEDSCAISTLFAELFEELRNNPNCSYVTYMNDVIKCGYNPSFISVMKKKGVFPLLSSIYYRNVGCRMYGEVCSSRVLNFFESPVTYETIIQEDVQNVYTASVDFSRPDDDFYTLDKFAYGYNETLEQNLNEIKISLQNVYSGKSDVIALSNANYRELIDNYLQNFCYSYLIRKYVLRDTDYDNKNIGIIVKPELGIIESAPNFDMDYCLALYPLLDDENNCTQFDMSVFADNHFDIMRADLNFVATNYPQVYNKFVNKLKLLRSIDVASGKPNYQLLAENSVGEDNPISRDLTQLLEVLSGLAQNECEKIVHTK